MFLREPGLLHGAEEEGQEPLPKDVKRTHETHCRFAKWCSVMGKQGNERRRGATSSSQGLHVDIKWDQ